MLHKFFCFHCVLLQLTILPLVVLAFVGPDGTCPIQVFAPFTRCVHSTVCGWTCNLMSDQLHLLPIFYFRNGDPYYGLFDRNFTVGFAVMAAAVLAVDHFNERNSSMVPDLAQFAPNGGSPCDVQLEIDKVFNTDGGESHEASRMLWDYVLFENETSTESESASSKAKSLCAFAGPMHARPASVSLLHGLKSMSRYSRSWMDRRR